MDSLDQSIIFKTQPIGIINPSNFCYIIASLQSLFNCKSFIYSLSLFKAIDDKLSAVLNLFNLDNNLYDSSYIKEKIDAGLDLIFKDSNDVSNNELLAKVLHKVNMPIEEFKVYCNKVKNYGNHIYIYIYMVKVLVEYINIIESRYKPLAVPETNINDIFISFIKISNKALQNIGIDELIDGNQHDAHELIITLLDIINDSHSFISMKPLPSHIVNISEDEYNAYDFNKRLSIGIKKTFHNINKDGYSILKNNMYFYTSQIINCKTCSFNSISFQENSMLNLPLPEENINDNYTLYDCLDKYFNIEIMDNDYKCDKCNTTNSCNKLKKYLMTKPNDIMIYLKRFNFDPSTMNMTKNNTTIKYPFILNLSKYYIQNITNITFTNPNNTNPISTNPSTYSIDLENNNDNENVTVEPNINVNLTYKLSSVICHKGRLNYGHYYSFICKNDTRTNNDIWYLCNDDTVQQVDNDTISNIIINSNAYILSYELIQ